MCYFLLIILIIIKHFYRREIAKMLPNYHKTNVHADSMDKWLCKLFKNRPLCILHTGQYNHKNSSILTREEYLLLYFHCFKSLICMWEHNLNVNYIAVPHNHMPVVNLLQNLIWLHQSCREKWSKAEFLSSSEGCNVHPCSLLYNTLNELKHRGLCDLMDYFPPTHCSV